MMNPATKTTNGAQLGIGVLLAISIAVLIAPPQQPSTQSSSTYVCRIQIEDAKIDTTLPTSIRSEDDDWDEDAPLESVSLDLNGDGTKEKLVPNKHLAGSGGCPWVIYNPAHDNVVGQIGAAIIFVQTKKTAGYSVLECYWKFGAGEATISYCEFNGEQYEISRKVDLSGEQIDQYFGDRKSVPRVRELRPGK